MAAAASTRRKRRIRLYRCGHCGGISPAARKSWRADFAATVCHHCYCVGKNTDANTWFAGAEQNDFSTTQGTMMELKVKKLHPAAIMPQYQSNGAACFDLHALLQPAETSYCMANRGTPAVIRTGLAFEIPPGWVMKIYSRSGHGFKNDVRLANCVGIIDSDYRGEVMVKLTNDNSDGLSLTVRHGDRIAQAMLVQVPRVSMVEVSELTTTERGENGFGSTGQQ